VGGSVPLQRSILVFFKGGADGRAERALSLWMTGGSSFEHRHLAVVLWTGYGHRRKLLSTPNPLALLSNQEPGQFQMIIWPFDDRDAASRYMRSMLCLFRKANSGLIDVCLQLSDHSCKKLHASPTYEQIKQVNEELACSKIECVWAHYHPVSYPIFGPPFATYSDRVCDLS